MNHLKYIFIFLFSYCFHSYAQQMPSMKIDNDTTYFSSDISFPFWLKSGQSLQSLQNVKNVSIIEFDVDSNGNMKFSRIVSGNLNTPSTVPAGKVWKMEAIGLSASGNYSFINSTGSIINAQLQSSTGFSNNIVPTIFTSPKIFNSPGAYQWKVPPNITRVCIEVWGGGGNAGNSINTSFYSSCYGGYGIGGGGGGGGYGYQCFTVTPNSVYSIIVGGSNQSSNFDNLISATSGQNGTDATCNINGTGGQGGTSTAFFNISGKSGSNGGEGGTGGTGGNGGNGGGAVSTIPCTQGNSGTGPSGGGGAGFQSSCQSSYYGSGRGAAGQVIIYW